MKKKWSQQHPVFPGGHPSKYWLDSTLLNFSDRTRTGVFNVIWPLAFERSKISVFEGPLTIGQTWTLNFSNISSAVSLKSRAAEQYKCWSLKLTLEFEIPSCKRLSGSWADPCGTAIQGQPVKPALQATDLVSPGKNQVNIEEDTWSSYQILSW